MSTATREGWPFSTLQRVRFGDLDAMQHMNNVEFLRFFEQARIDYLSSFGEDKRPGDPTSRRGFGFIFGECKITYRAPAFYNDEIRTWIRPGRIGNASLVIEFEMLRDSDGTLLAEGYGVLVGYDYEQGVSQPLPDAFRELLAGSGDGTGTA